MSALDTPPLLRVSLIYVILWLQSSLYETYGAQQSSRVHIRAHNAGLSRGPWFDHDPQHTQAMHVAAGGAEAPAIAAMTRHQFEYTHRSRVREESQSEGVLTHNADESTVSDKEMEPQNSPASAWSASSNAGLFVGPPSSACPGATGVPCAGTYTSHQYLQSARQSLRVLVVLQHFTDAPSACTRPAISTLLSGDYDDPQSVVGQLLAASHHHVDVEVGGIVGPIESNFSVATGSCEPDHLGWRAAAADQAERLGWNTSDFDSIVVVHPRMR